MALRLSDGLGVPGECATRDKRRADICAERAALQRAPILLRRDAKLMWPAPADIECGGDDMALQRPNLQIDFGGCTCEP